MISVMLENNNSYFISSCDDGDPSYIHPTTKRYICERVVKSILGVNYEKPYLTASPTFKKVTFENNTAIVEFNNGEGLYNKGEITNLYIAGEDGKYFSATGTIKDDKLYVTSEKVNNPKYVKYGFAKSPFVNIFNKDDYSLAPFRSDELNLNIDLLDYNSLESYTFHPDGSKMNISYNNNNLVINFNPSWIGNDNCYYCLAAN